MHWFLIHLYSNFLSAREASQYVFISSNEDQSITQKPMFDLDLKVNHTFERRNPWNIYGFRFDILDTAQVELQE